MKIVWIWMKSNSFSIHFYRIIWSRWRRHFFWLCLFSIIFVSIYKYIPSYSFNNKIFIFYRQIDMIFKKYTLYMYFYGRMILSITYTLFYDTTKYHIYFGNDTWYLILFIGLYPNEFGFTKLKNLKFFFLIQFNVNQMLIILSYDDRFFEPICFFDKKNFCSCNWPLHCKERRCALEIYAAIIKLYS